MKERGLRGDNYLHFNDVFYSELFSAMFTKCYFSDLLIKKNQPKLTKKTYLASLLYISIYHPTFAN